MSTTADNMACSCIYCNARQNRLLYPTRDMYGNNFTVRQCRQCEAVFLWPPPTTKQLEQAYSETYYGEQEHKFNSLVERVVDYFRSRRAKIISRWVPPPGRVLDIGCGNGRFLHYMQGLGNYETYGIELPGKAAERAAQINGLILKQGKLEPNDFSEGFFDAITLFHVFEHLDQPRQTLQIINKIVKPGGIAYISLPNIDSLQSKWFKGKWLHLDPPRHLFFLSPKNLQHQMNQLGFELAAERYFNPEYNPFGMQQSLLNLLLNKRDVLFEYLKGHDNYTKEYSPLNLFLQNLFFKTTFPLFVLTDALESLLKKGATVEMVFRKK
ncbi:class I SAM-dependent methyltransferase [Sphingobacteriales bacterium UPWRP_1]|nr:hypothetical protein BVG80_15385 [Sphingobacteriales bacterium TSM_CSM]PSJ79130.1 class I SAM-dependent methyltransferase [Sphingobacteriales bacterium UPWRP_1]